jgi:acyl-CoA thioesterase
VHVSAASRRKRRTNLSSSLSTAAAYLTTAAGGFSATQLTRGLWSPLHQHAGPAIALVAGALEAAAASHGLTHMARLTGNLLRPIPIDVLMVEVAEDYVGKNVGHFRAELMAQGKVVARFSALFQRPVEVTLSDSLAGHPLPMASKPPDDLQTHRFFALDGVGYPDLVETRVANGRVFQEPSAVWFRLNHPIVSGETPSPYQRVAVAADSGNGISAVLDLRHYIFVNADITINLLRRPVGEWICLDARTSLSEHGSGLAESALYDTIGLIGRATQSLFVMQRS